MKRLGVALLLAAVLGAGTIAALRWPSRAPLDCPPGELHLDDAGVARCGPGEKLSAAQTLTAGGKLDLNQATEDELAVIPGVGPKLAKAIVDERKRLGKFERWEQVDAVSGVGDARLDQLKATAEIR